MLWTLPGVDHLTHGVNIFTGVEEISPLFEFTYCKGNDSRELQDSYRGYIYQIPEQVFNCYCVYDVKIVRVKYFLD